MHGPSSLGFAATFELEQRIVGTAHLTALGREELPAYVDHLLGCVQASLPLTPSHLDQLLHLHHSRGIPRLVTAVLRLWLDPPDPAHPTALHQALTEAGFTPPLGPSSDAVG